MFSYRADGVSGLIDLYLMDGVTQERCGLCFRRVLDMPRRCVSCGLVWCWECNEGDRYRRYCRDCQGEV